MALTYLPKLKALDLFAGCGGLTEGLIRAGFDVIGAVEIDRQTSETYKLNHPTVQVWNKDIRDIHVSTVKRRLGLRNGTLDLLAGCPPCQGFSTMRTLNGNKAVNDPKNDLLMEFLRFVEELRPKAVMMENVTASRASAQQSILAVTSCEK
jgi:DNA (cytosine-5)-methyltransferase 1